MIAGSGRWMFVAGLGRKLCQELVRKLETERRRDQVVLANEDSLVPEDLHQRAPAQARRAELLGISPEYVIDDVLHITTVHAVGLIAVPHRLALLGIVRQ